MDITISRNTMVKAGAGLLLAAAGCLVAGTAVGEVPRSHLGEAVKVGNGSARVMVTENAAGKPASVSVVLSETALQGLPAGHGGMGHESFEFVLPMPAAGPRTGFDHVTLDWNPHGHDPNGIYSTPHFDVHFYTIDGETRKAITYKGAAAEDAKIAPAAELVPAGFVVPPDTAIEQMGVHGVNPAGPEFQGKPFTATFIYGYHKGEGIFIEPMVAKSWLETKPDVTLNVPRPQAYSRPGYYPGRYRVAYDAERRHYVIALTQLQAWKME